MVRSKVSQLAMAVSLVLGMGFSSQAMAGEIITSNNNCKANNPYPQPNETATWSGECKDGWVHGQGTFQWYKDGKPIDTYIGEYKEGKRHGQGTQTWANGNKYVGEYKDDKRNGQGTYTWANGDKYVGEWKDDKRHGLGKQTIFNGDSGISSWRNGGRWVDNVFVVQGRFVNHDISANMSDTEYTEALAKEAQAKAEKEKQEAEQKAKAEQAKAEKEKQEAEQAKIITEFKQKFATNPSQTQADLMAKGMWYDERTGLIWDRCFLGQTWNGSECVGEIGKYKITEEVVRNGLGQYSSVNLEGIVSQHKLGGFHWSLPTRTQLHTIVDCPNGYRNGSFRLMVNGQELRYNSECAYTGRYALDESVFPLPQDKKQNGGSLWVATADTHQIKADGRWVMVPYIYDFYFIVYAYTGGRGGNISNPAPDQKVAIKPVVAINSLDMNAYKKLLVDDRGEFTQKIIDNEKAEKERLAKEKAEREAEQARKEQEAYDRKVAAFRKNLQVGDDAKQGMVIEIKGNLIKIQTNDSQCTQRDYNGKCTNYMNTPVEKWVKRSELHPAY